MDPSWTEEASYGRDPAILRSRRGKCSTHSGSCSNAVQSSTKCTFSMGISRIQNQQSIIQNKEGGIIMNIIQCYAPTNDSNDDIKDQFYEAATVTHREVHKKGPHHYDRRSKCQSWNRQHRI
ncbi:unnamed protein product [Schistosoma mattheei]|uniref:Uncharacterized protein n=1 Tax=Schistosoma mattheei TaxID=31246 RepID=A0A3P8FR68_9TREM|nr:unnamed protein product [Schistosoma mattheei]